MFAPSQPGKIIREPVVIADCVVKIETGAISFRETGKIDAD